jgi:hypothetical protein
MGKVLPNLCLTVRKDNFKNLQAGSLSGVANSTENPILPWEIANIKGIVSRD